MHEFNFCDFFNRTPQTFGVTLYPTFIFSSFPKTFCENKKFWVTLSVIKRLSVRVCAQVLRWCAWEFGGVRRYVWECVGVSGCVRMCHRCVRVCSGVRGPVCILAIHVLSSWLR